MNVLFSFLFNVCLALPSLTAALTLPDIQQLMKYFSSILGFIIMIIVPTILVFGFRKKFLKSKLEDGKLNKAFLRQNWQLASIACFGFVLFSFIIYGFINSNNKTCVAQK